VLARQCARAGACARACVCVLCTHDAASQVNQGPLEIARVFLARSVPASAIGPRDDTKALQAALRAQFQVARCVARTRTHALWQRFIDVTGEAVALNAQIIADDQVEFQKQLENGYATTSAELARLIE
jgi:hypothetical protein